MPSPTGFSIFLYLVAKSELIVFGGSLFGFKRVAKVNFPGAKDQRRFEGLGGGQ